MIFSPLAAGRPHLYHLSAHFHPVAVHLQQTWAFRNRNRIHSFFISQTQTSPVFRPLVSLIIQGKQDQCCSLLCPWDSMISIFQPVLGQMHGHHHPFNKWSSALFNPKTLPVVCSHHEWHRPMWKKEAVVLWISCLQRMGSKSLFMTKNIYS